MSGKRLLCIGECMVEMAPAGAATYRMGFAGDTFNTAWYARRLLPAGWSVGYCSRVGTDATSARMLAFMTDAGIDVNAVARDPDATVGLYMIQTDNGERSFSYWRGQSAARRLADDPDWLAGVLNAGDVLFFSGITLAILPPDARTRFCAALATARAAGKTVAFDTNMRPRLWQNPEAMRAGILQGAAVADIVFPSLDEEQATFGDDDAASVAARYHGAGAGLVVVTNGAGAVLVSRTGDDPVTATPPKVDRIIDTTAAGDSFDAGFLAALLTGADPETAAHKAMELSARVVQSAGALVSLD